MKRILLVLCCLATRAYAEERLPLVVVLHGYGGSPENIARVVEGLAVKARVITPHGSLPVGQGWGWFPRRASPGAPPLADGIRAAADTLAKTIADEVRDHPGCGRPIVTGFSQGGFLSYALAARSPAIVGFAAPIGGLLPAVLVPAKKPDHAPAITAFHGDADRIVELEKDRATSERFRSVGYQATLKTYPGVGHEVPPEEASDVRHAIEEAIRAEGCAR